MADSCSWCMDTAGHHDTLCAHCATLLTRWVDGVIATCLLEADDE